MPVLSFTDVSNLVSHVITAKIIDNRRAGVLVMHAVASYAAAERSLRGIIRTVPMLYSNGNIPKRTRKVQLRSCNFPHQMRRLSLTNQLINATDFQPVANTSIEWR